MYYTKGVFGVLNLESLPDEPMVLLDGGIESRYKEDYFFDNSCRSNYTMLCKDREVQSFEYTEARKAYFTEQMICEILIALEQTAMSLDMEYDDRQKAMSTDLSKAARKEWYLRHKDKGMEP